MLTQKNGFSLLELLVVVACLLILMVMSVPNWLRTQWPSYRLRGAAQRMVADIRYAKIRAATTNRRYRIVVSPKTNSYHLEKSELSAGRVTWTPENPAQGAGGCGMLPKDISLVSISVAPVLIHPTGTLSATTIILQNLNGHRIKIACSMAGRIRMERTL